MKICCCKKGTLNCILLKRMNYLSIQRFCKSRKFPRDKGHYNKQIIQLKRQRSIHTGQLTKTINKVSDLIDCEKSFEEVVKCNNLLEISIKAIQDITRKIIRHKTDNKITKKVNRILELNKNFA